jgi:hypothetical protein
VTAFRVYFTNTAQTSPTPAFDASWTTAPTRRRQAPTATDNSAMTGVSITLPGTTAIGADYGHTQFYTAAIGSGLAAALVTGGVTVKGQIECTTQAAGAHLITQAIVKVYDPVGVAIRGTVLTYQSPADPVANPPYLNEATTETNRKIPSSANSLPLSTSALAGCISTDVLLIEIGFHSYASVAAGNGAFFQFGSPNVNTDLPEDETTTGVANNGWFELTYTSGTTFVPKIIRYG